MPKIIEPEVWIGRTRNRAALRIYVTGRKANGSNRVWILGSSEARQGGLPGFPSQGTGFPNELAAERFARSVFEAPGKPNEFISHDLNPLSVARADAPQLLRRISLRTGASAAPPQMPTVSRDEPLTSDASNRPKHPKIHTAAVGADSGSTHATASVSDEEQISTIDRGYEDYPELNAIFGIRFQNVSVGPDPFGYLVASGEVLTVNGGVPRKPFRIIVGAVDRNGHIIGVGDSRIGKGGFHGILAFRVFLGKPPGDQTLSHAKIAPEETK